MRTVYCDMCERWVPRDYPHTCYDVKAVRSQQRQKLIETLLSEPFLFPIPFPECKDMESLLPPYPKDEECFAQSKEECSSCLQKCDKPEEDDKFEAVDPDCSKDCEICYPKGDEKVNRTDIYVDCDGCEWTLGEAVLRYANEIDESKGEGNPFEAILYIIDENNESYDAPFWTEVLKGMLSEVKYFRYREELS